jgi:hypothetical protein
VASDEDANRIRELIACEPDVSEQTMFGGLTLVVGGRMSVPASGQGSLVVRVDPKETVGHLVVGSDAGRQRPGVDEAPASETFKTVAELGRTMRA